MWLKKNTNKIYCEEKSISATEDYPLLSSKNSMFFMNFEILKLLKKLPPFENSKFIVPLSKIKREESIFIYVSHVWLTELSSIPGNADFTHPDNRENEKYTLLVDGIQKILDSMTSAKTANCFVWLDYCCAPKEAKIASDIPIERVMEVCDIMLTPVVDTDFRSWKLPAGVVDYYKDYKAQGWNGGFKSYLNRGRCRTEMFFAADVTLPEHADGSPRFDLFRGEIAFYLKKGRRPHLLYGTSEMQSNSLPIVLAPLQFTQYSELNPLQGYFAIEQEKLFMQELVDHFKFDKNEVVPNFKGNMNNEKKFGFGVLSFSNGNIYKGEFEEDLKDGRGKMLFANGDVYDGEWREDMMCGTGIMRYANGSIYIGKFSNNARHGQGVLQEKDWILEAGVLKEYNGVWYQDKQNGWGLTTFANGDEHEGEYKEGQRHGPGVLRDCDKNVLFDGMFVADQVNGFGMMNYDNGDVYSGHFKAGVRHGKGRLFFKNGDSYEGDFKNDVIEGEGVLISPGESYAGSFANGMKHGQGEIAYENGDLFSGNFNKGQPFGHGVMRYANGRKVPLVNGKKKRLLSSCIMLSAAAMIIIATDVFGI